MSLSTFNPISAAQKRGFGAARRGRQRGVSWTSWSVGVFMGAVGCWLLIGDVSGPQTLPSLPADEVVVTEEAAEDAAVGDAAEDIVDNLPIEFYRLLPDTEEQVADDLIGKQARQDTSAATATAGARYRLQAGSFQYPQDADRRRAAILLLGLEAGIEKVTHGGRDWHRVMLGPFASLGDLEAAKSRLRTSGIDSIAVKMK